MAADTGVSRGDFLRGAAAGALAASGATPVAVATAALRSASHGAKRTAKREWLFVQTARRATWRRKRGTKDVYSLVLEGVSPQTVAFTDRPYRDVRTPPTDRFLRGLGFGRLQRRHGRPVGGPNAAILAPRSGKQAEDVLVVALYAPSYEPDKHRLTYEARPLHHAPSAGLRTVRRRQHDFTLPEHFEDASLFIDSCASWCVDCTRRTEKGGVLLSFQRVGRCWSWEEFSCRRCQNTSVDVCKTQLGTEWQRTGNTEPCQYTGPRADDSSPG